MINDLKKRISTSIVLIFLLFLMLLNHYILAYFLIVIGILSLQEFFKIILIIYKKNNFRQLISNILFITYIFSFCLLFFIFSSFSSSKVLLFLILLTCVASDIGGFLFGKLFKGPKLTKISPKKTISGAIGSILLSVIFYCSVIYYLTKDFQVSLILVGFLTSIGSQLGDLFFSFLKRKSFLKDTGNFLPGHGGILDRIDGILLGLPVGFVTLLIIY